MIDEYLLGKTTAEIAKNYGFKTRKTVEDTLKKYNVSVRPPRERRKLNYNFFEKIDSHNKAYILGLIYTDGYILKNYEGFGIQLTASDGYLLEKIAFYMGRDAVVRHINCDTKRQHMPNAKNMVRLSVYSKTIAEQLQKLGVVKHKTYSLHLSENIPHEYMFSFMRGVIDGDGTLGIYRGCSFNCRIVTMSADFADGISNYPFDAKIKVYTSKQSGIKSIQINGGQKRVLDFLNKVYENKNDLYLIRKYEKYEAMQDCFSKKYGNSTYLQSDNEI